MPCSVPFCIVVVTVLCYVVLWVVMLHLGLFKCTIVTFLPSVWINLLFPHPTVADTHVAHPLVRAATVEFHSTVSERGAPSFPTGRTGGRDTEGTAQSSAPPYTARTRVCTALPPTLVFSRTPGYVLLSLWPRSALFRLLERPPFTIGSITERPTATRCSPAQNIPGAHYGTGSRF